MLRGPPDRQLAQDLRPNGVSEHEMEVCMLPRHIRRIRRTAIIAAAGFILITPAVARAQFAMCGDRARRAAP